MIAVGDNAPDFTLYDSDKQQVKLSNFKGKKVLILFFPLAFTGVCTDELCSVRDGIAFYNDADAEVLAISVDSLFCLDKFKQEQNLNIKLLSDFNKEVSTSYGALYEEFVLDMKGVSKRSAFVVDREGKLAYTEVLESAGDLPNFEAIQAAITAIA